MCPVASHEEPPEAILLDIDGTQDTVYRSQQLWQFNAYSNGYCYQPLHIYEDQTGKCDHGYFASGKAADEQRDRLHSQTVDRLPIRAIRTLPQHERAQRGGISEVFVSENAELHGYINQSF